jgi:hypothetical protein
MSCYASKRKPRHVWRDASGASIGDYAFACVLGIVGGLSLFYGL